MSASTPGHPWRRLPRLYRLIAFGIFSNSATTDAGKTAGLALGVALGCGDDATCCTALANHPLCVPISPKMAANKTMAAIVIARLIPIPPNAKTIHRGRILGLASLGRPARTHNQICQLSRQNSHTDVIESTRGSSGPQVLWSITATPTYQYERFFIRGECSFVAANHTRAGFAFGPHGSDKTQARVLVETGILF
jgi:hypothetical protein